MDTLPPPPDGEQATESLSTRVFPSVKSEVEQVAIIEGRNVSQQVHWLIREALEGRRKKPPRPPAMRQQKVRTAPAGYTTRPPGALDDVEQIDVKLAPGEDTDTAEGF